MWVKGWNIKINQLVKVVYGVYIYIYLYIYIKVQWIKISTVASKNISAVFFAMLISMLIAGRS